jgi:hypothetical protein
MSFDHIDTASRMRRIIQRISQQQASIVSPDALIGRMTFVDINSLKGRVWIAGDTAPVEVNLFSSTIPGSWQEKDSNTSGDPNTPTVGIGSTVVVESYRGSLYVTEVLTSGQFSADFRAVNAGIAAQGSLGQIAPSPNDTWNVSPVQTVRDYFSSEVVQYFTLPQGDALIFGPFTMANSGSWFDPGWIEMTVHNFDYDVHFAAKHYKFMLNPHMMASDFDFIAEPNFFDRWFRILPDQTITDYFDQNDIGGNSSGDFDLDVCLRSTNYGLKVGGVPGFDQDSIYELWFRVVKIDPGLNYNEFAVNFHTSAFQHSRALSNVGRLIQIVDAAPPTVKGYVGFHNARHAFHDADRASTVTTFEGGQWDNGPWRSSVIRTASDLQKTWQADGNISWDGSNLKWTGNIYLGGLGKHRDALSAGRATITCPTSGTIPVMGLTSTTVTCTASGIPIAANRSLWCGIPPASGNTDLKLYLFLVDDTGTVDYQLPEWAVFLARRGPTGATPDIVLGDGTKLDSWRNLTLANGWTNRGAGFATGQYRRVNSPPNSLQLVGCLVAGTKTNATTVATTAVGFRPAAIVGFPCQDTANPAAIEFDTLGQLKVYDLGAGSNLQFSVIVPLDKT